MHDLTIYRQKIAKETIGQLLQDIKANRSYAGIDDAFVLERLRAFLSENKKARLFLAGEYGSYSTRSKQYKEIVKAIRRLLHKKVEVFGIVQKRGHILSALEELLKKKQIDLDAFLALHEEMLATHLSTQERLPAYTGLYAKIFSLTGKPKIILDLGCGLNPFSYLFMGVQEIVYHAYDIDEKIVGVLKTYFTLHKKISSRFDGQAELLDLLALPKETKKLPTADLAFLFKMTDALEQSKGHKVSELIFEKIPSRFLVVSFATKTLSGKAMRHPRRGWIELLCKRKGWKFDVIEEENEVFYVIRKEGE